MTPHCSRTHDTGGTHMSDSAKTPEQDASNPSTEQVNDLPAKAINDQDAEAVKGGAELYGKIIGASPILSAYKPQ